MEEREIVFCPEMSPRSLCPRTRVDASAAIQRALWTWPFGLSLGLVGALL